MYAFAAQSGATLFGLPAGVVVVLTFVPFIMAAFSALRLAKFNIDDTQHESFSGLPTPANAIFCLSFVYAAVAKGITVEVEWVALISIVMAALLVSPIRMFSFKFKSLAWEKNKVRYIFLATSVLAICLLKLYAIPAIIVLYMAVSTVRWIAKKR